jgi:hypothetical protein
VLPSAAYLCAWYFCRMFPPQQPSLFSLCVPLCFCNSSTVGLLSLSLLFRSAFILNLSRLWTALGAREQSRAGRVRPHEAENPEPGLHLCHSLWLCKFFIARGYWTRLPSRKLRVTTYSPWLLPLGRLCPEPLFCLILTIVIYGLAWALGMHCSQINCSKT